jgi:predicted amidophosphoribosyltransferase
MRGMAYRERRANAEDSLRAALHVPDPSVTRGRRIIVVDDVFTDGLTLREVARVLMAEGGAAEVLGVTLARQPFGRR